jgi:CRP/FNR family transcriptional regulator, cyclic AMP receptor protein
MQWIGYLAATLVFCTFAMRTMVPLRIVAIGSNVAFIAYAAPLHLWPIAILHGLLLPMNALRLCQVRRMLAALRVAETEGIDVTPLLTLMEKHQHAAGVFLFRKGDAADCAYYILSGEIEFPERHAHLGPGHFFGEVGVFASRGVRTGSARCVSDVTLYAIRKRDLVAAYYSSPPLAMALIGLIADRMGDNLALADAALMPAGVHQAGGVTN